MIRLLLILLLMMVSASVTNVVKHPQEPPSFVESGKATYYADNLAGKKTASGEPYQPHLLTAAHKTLPFGTLVKVSCSETQKSVVVKINDRGPFVKNRIIDLSKSAFQQIHSLHKGEIEVVIEVVSEE